MNEPEMALLDLTLAASNLKRLADAALLHGDDCRMAEALLFVARGLERSHGELREVVVAHCMRRAGARPAPVVVLSEAAHGRE